MRKTLTTIGIAAAATIGSTGFAVAAQATTPAATTGALGAYAGTQIDGNQLAIDMFQQNVKAPVAAWPNASNDPATDWAWIVPPGNYPAGSKEAIYDPSGKDSGLCLTETGTTHAIVVKACTGSASQVWAYNGTGWTNAADGLVLTEHGKGKQLTDATAVSGDAAQAWAFSS